MCILVFRKPRSSWPGKNASEDPARSCARSDLESSTGRPNVRKALSGSGSPTDAVDAAPRPTRSRGRLAQTSAAVFRVENDARGVPRTTITYPELASCARFVTLDLRCETCLTPYVVGHDKRVGVFASIQGVVVRIAIDETTKARIQHASRATVTHLIFMTGRT